MSDQNPYGIQYREYPLSTKEKARIELLVSIENAIENHDREALLQLIPQCQEVGNGNFLIRKINQELYGKS